MEWAMNRWIPILAVAFGAGGCIERFDDFGAGAPSTIQTIDVVGSDGAVDVPGAPPVDAVDVVDPVDTAVQPGDVGGDVPVQADVIVEDDVAMADATQDASPGDAEDGGPLPDVQPGDVWPGDALDDIGATDIAVVDDATVDALEPADASDTIAVPDVPAAADADTQDGDPPPDADAQGESCGDGVCSAAETCASCEVDCGCDETELCIEGACCAPNCAGRECGDDGCGGSCGVCPAGSACAGGQCAPGCGDGACSGLETCGSCPGDCPCDADTVCHQDACCAPDCAGKVCGGDGCGGTCGACPAGTSCDQGTCAPGCGDGLCAGAETCETCPSDCACPGGSVCFAGECCTPSCGGKQCGKDTCGGSCGACPAGQTCGEGQCVAVCGDGTCDATETCTGCPADCGACGGTCEQDCGPYAPCDASLATCVTKTVKIPAGSFYMGCKATVDPACQPDETPYHLVSVSTFGVDMTEVTNGQFAAFLNATASNGKDNLCSFESAGHPCLITSTEAQIPTLSDGTWAPPTGAADLPVTGVTWYGATSFCAWTGRRLCREAEWEKAARGGCELYADCESDSPIYPWGNGDANCMLAVMAADGPGCVTGGPRDVASLPASSGYGVHDMAGNVWEWVADWYSPTWYETSPGADPVGPASAKARARRGGGYADVAESLRVSKRAFAEPFKADAGTGFRCCEPSCGDGTCEAGIGETCATCPADCGCSDGGVCVGGACCVPSCDEEQCSDDGCGGACGPCPVNEVCEPGGCKAYLAKPGDIVITEIKARPGTEPQTLGEWFEITNTTGVDLDLAGWELNAWGADDSSKEYHTIAAPLVIPAYGILVFAYDGNPANNGGIVPDYVYATPGDASEVRLSESTHLSLIGPPQLEMFDLIDEVSFDPETLPTDPARSTSLDASKTTATQNDDPSSWCLSGAPLPGGGYGTPGLANESCL